MPRTVWLSCGLFASTVLGACASTSGLEMEMSRMRRDLAEVKKELADTELALQRLEGQVTILSLGRDHAGEVEPTAVARTAEAEAPGASSKSGPLAARGSPGSARPPARSRSASPGSRAKGKAETDPGRVLPVVRLSGKAEPIEREESAFEQGALDDGSPPLLITLHPEDDGSRERIPVDHEVLKKADPALERAQAIAPAAMTAEIEAEYGAALAKLRTEGKPEEALALFETFSARHPRSNLKENAIYWGGECQFALGAHAAAIEVFERLIREHPRSGKVPDSLVRIGESWIAMSAPAKAQAALKQVIESYPRSEAAGRARARLDSLALGGER